MWRGAFLILVAGSFVGCGFSDEAPAGQNSSPVVYGADDRLDVYEEPDPALQEVARRSILALIQRFRLVRADDGSYGLAALSLQEERDLCEGERFANQPVAASCSGTLIDDDLVLTAGHCISNSRLCDDYLYVFNFLLDGPNLLAPIRDEDVYECKQVFVERDAPRTSITPDYVVIQLDRPVQGAHSPAEIRPAAVPLERGAPLTMIGFGSGLPAKIDSGASVAEPPGPQGDFFIANVDAFEGHSGSAVFDSNDQLAGILLGGRVPDYVEASGGLCYRVNVFDDSEAGEIVHDVSTIVRGLCDEGWQRGDTCETSACQGDACGTPAANQDAGVGVTPAGKSGCSAASTPPTWAASWAALGMLLVARRLRRRGA